MPPTGPRPAEPKLTADDEQLPAAPLVPPNRFAYLHLAAELERPRPLRALQPGTARWQSG